MEIGQKVKELRKNLNLTQKEFSQKIGVSVKTIVFWESGENEPSKSNLFTICNKCNLPINYFEDKNQNVIKNVSRDDKIEINYWSELPEELKNPKIVSVWLDKEVVENAWNINPDNLAVVPMIDNGMCGYWYKINAGDLLIIDRKINHFNESGVYFCTSKNNTRFWIREVKMLINENIEFHNYSISGEFIKTYTQEQLKEVDFKIIGKVIKNISFRL